MKKITTLLAVCILSGGLVTLAWGDNNGNGKGNGNGNPHSAPELSWNSFSAGVAVLTVGALFLRRKKSR